MLDSEIFFSGAGDLLRVAVIGVLAYAGLLVILRTSGKRTLSKMNAFDFVVTVALGSTLATILLSKDVALAEGLAALALLVLLQFCVTWLSVRSVAFRGWIKAEPRLLFHDGAFLEAAMRAERITRDEMIAAIRQQGIAGPEQVSEIVLETDGSLSVVERAAPR